MKFSKSLVFFVLMLIVSHVRSADVVLKKEQAVRLIGGLNKDEIRPENFVSVWDKINQFRKTIKGEMRTLGVALKNQEILQADFNKQRKLLERHHDYFVAALKNVEDKFYQKYAEMNSKEFFDNYLNNKSKISLELNIIGKTWRYESMLFNQEDEDDVITNVKLSNVAFNKRLCLGAIGAGALGIAFLYWYVSRKKATPDEPQIPVKDL